MSGDHRLLLLLLFYSQKTRNFLDDLEQSYIYYSSCMFLSPHHITTAQ